MSEPVLRALMQLFALVSDIGNINEISQKERNVVRSFLDRQLNSELVEKYLRIFDEFLELFVVKEAITERTEDFDIADLKSIRIKRICEDINFELLQKQKIYIVIQLIDFISYGKEITDNELDFLMTVALALNFPENEYRNIKSFIIDPVSKIREKDKLLLINNNQSCKFQKIKHIYNPNFNGELGFLYIPSTKSLILRYSGTMNLYLNGHHIFPKQSYLFDNGSSVKGRGLKPVYYSEVYGYFNESKSETNVSLAANDITYLFADSENGIQKFNFYEESGQLVGIIGLSGTGKSTLLNLLNGNLKPQSGNVLVNGYDLNNPKDREKLKGIIGYIPQDDLLIEELTVYQNLYFNARLCLSNLSVNKIKKTVAKIMTDLDLWEIRDLKVGSPLDKVISGGQRKRINIALELVREPYILFVDEPTSGLSSLDSEVVMNLLKEQAYKGRLVIVNIHQPCSDLYKLFDKIIILDKGGYQIYYGNPNAAIVYFRKNSSHANPEEDQCPKCGNINTDQLLQIVDARVIDEHGRQTQIRRTSPEEWANRFRQNFLSQHGSATVNRKRLPESLYSIPSVIMQMAIFFRRDFLSKLSNRQYILISLLGAPLLALLLGYFTRYSQGERYEFISNDNLTAYLFMCVITALFLGLIISSEEILKDRKILKREAFLSLSWFSYINSKTAMMFMISAVQTLLFVVVGNLILGIKGMTLQYWLILFTTACCANMIGLNLSSALNSVITIYILIPFILIPQLLFSGVLVKYDKLHISGGIRNEYVPVIGELMPARWSFEALAMEQFRNNRYEKAIFPYDVAISLNDWYSAYMIYDLEKILYDCRRAATINDTVKNDCYKLRSYINEMSKTAGFEVPSDIVEAIGTNRLDSLSSKKIQMYLMALKIHFTSEKRAVLNSRDSLVKALTKTRSDSLEYINLKTDYYNKGLASFILNDDPGIKKSIERQRKIIRKYQPGYMVPTSLTGRAHFCAPVKVMGNTEIDTFWFNLLVIWSVSIILYSLLYFNVLKRLVGGSGESGRGKSDQGFLEIKEISSS
jgi:ABC-type multidrug transport system ATPase subunit